MCKQGLECIVWLYLLSWNNLIFSKICKWRYCFEWVPNQSFSVEWHLSFTDWITIHQNIGNVYKHWVFTQFSQIFLSSTSTICGLAPLVEALVLWQCFFTVRKRSCGKVMFLHLSVVSPGGGLPQCMLGYTPLVRPPEQTPPWETPPSLGRHPLPGQTSLPGQTTPWAD